MKKQQKTDYCENATKPSLFSGEPANRVPLLEKTNPILTPQISLQPLILQWFTTLLFKIPQKKRTQLKPISNTIKPSLFLGETSFSGNLFLRNKPNFNHSNITTTSYITVVYNDSQTKPKNGANPNKPNLKPISKPQNRRFSIASAKENKSKQTQSKANFHQVASKPWRRWMPKLFSVLLAPRFIRRGCICQKNHKNRKIPPLTPSPYPLTPIRIMKSKPNFKNLSTTLTREMKGTYPNIHPQTHKKSKPKANPIQTQSKPNLRGTKSLFLLLDNQYHKV